MLRMKEEDFMAVIDVNLKVNISLLLLNLVHVILCFTPRKHLNPSHQILDPRPWAPNPKP